MPTSPRPSLTIQTRMPSPLPEQRLDVPIPATPPQRRARSTSPKGTPIQRGTPRSTSPGYRYGGSTASPRPDHGSPSLGSSLSYEPATLSGGVSGIGKAVGQRVLRTVRRGNLPFLIVFVSCIIVFFTSLAGVGYVAPEEISRTVEFLPGTPVFDLAGRQALERRMQEQKALENEWAKKKRPKDGAWMQRARDDKAIRRRPSHAVLASEVAATQAAIVARDEKTEAVLAESDGGHQEGSES